MIFFFEAYHSLGPCAGAVASEVRCSFRAVIYRLCFRARALSPIGFLVLYVATKLVSVCGKPHTFCVHLRQRLLFCSSTPLIFWTLLSPAICCFHDRLRLLQGSSLDLVSSDGAACYNMLKSGVWSDGVCRLSERFPRHLFGACCVHPGAVCASSLVGGAQLHRRVES